MPLYPFKCRDCLHEFSMTMSHDVDDKAAEAGSCPACDHPEVKRVFTPTNDVWKTGGAYKTEAKDLAVGVGNHVRKGANKLRAENGEAPRPPMKVKDLHE